MALADLTDWLDEHSRRESLWYAKRLSANDTLANNTHQAGPYVPKNVLFQIFPGLKRPDEENPEVRFELFVDSHCDTRSVRAVWYNNKQRGGTRDEARLTGFGGKSSPLLDPESTGALVLFVFSYKPGKTVPDCHVWVCEHATQEDLIEDRIGPVEPGKGMLWSPDIPVGIDLVVPPSSVRSNCFLLENEIPPEWLLRFPGGAEIIKKTVEFRPLSGVNPDARLLKRRECEYEIFQSVEEVMKLPIIRLVVPEGLRHACPGAEVSETRDLDENTMIDLDQKGQICAITVEHAIVRADIPHFSFEQIPAPDLAKA